MSILQNSNAISAGGYDINNSLRFRGSASAYLSRTPSSAGNRKTWTWSAWIKLGTISVNMGTLFIAQGQTAIYLNDGTNSSFRVNGAAGSDLITSLMPRDPSAWYHLVVACDTTQATDTNRLKIYVNGVQQTAFQAGSAYPTLNGDTYVNSTAAHYIGRRVWNSDQQYDGYLTEVNFIDGQALTPSSFGSTNSTTGVWQPKQYTGTYGTNGFYLNFSNIALTSGSNTGLGKDYSGNGNYWNTNNISVTNGTTYDAMTDVPTLTSATVANYCTINPLLDLQTYATYSEGNLKVSTTASAGYAMRMLSKGTMAIPSSGKWYFAANAGDCGIIIGSDDPNRTQYGASLLTTNVRYQSGGDVLLNNNSYATVASFTVSDEVGFAIDMDALTVGIYKNGSLLTTVTGVTSGFTYYPMTITNSSSTAYTAYWNFGQRPFAYTPPTGFVALNTYNLPTSTIVQGNKYMDATLYTGNATNRSIVNAGAFKPDLVWIKERNGVGWNIFTDSVRGITKNIYSNSTNAEATNNGTDVTSFNSDGFGLGIDSNGDGVNRNGNTVVAWQWQAGQGTTSSNTSGSITSTVSVNTTAGFSIVTYTGTGANATVGHGLGVAPKMVIVKSRSYAGTQWVVWHTGLTSGAYTTYLNLTNAQASAPTVWNSTIPTSTVFSVGTNADSNNSGSTYVAYCWAEIAGFSKFGSYTGNGSADGVFVYLGFRPKFIIIKQSSAAGENWVTYDTVRNTYNVANLLLHPNLSNAESTTTLNTIDILSNGFKLRGSSGLTNTSSATYIFMAFAENPFKNSLAR